MALKWIPKLGVCIKNSVRTWRNDAEGSDWKLLELFGEKIAYVRKVKSKSLKSKDASWSWSACVIRKRGAKACRVNGWKTALFLGRQESIKPSWRTAGDSGGEENRAKKHVKAECPQWGEVGDQWLIKSEYEEIIETKSNNGRRHRHRQQPYRPSLVRSFIHKALNDIWPDLSDKKV